MEKYKLCRLLISIFAILMLFASVLNDALAQEFPLVQNGSHLVGNSEVAATLLTPNGEERVTGRVSFHLVSTAGSLEKGFVTIRGFNILFTGVTQKLIAGNLQVQEPLGVLGFATVSDELQMLQYDEKNKQLFGTVNMYADASFLNSFAQPTYKKYKFKRKKSGRKEFDDFFDTPVLPAKANIRIDLKKGLNEVSRNLRQLDAKLDFDLFTEETFIPDGVVAEIQINLRDELLVPIEIGSVLQFGVDRRLCVQPVRVVRFIPGLPLQLSGVGLPFGQPRAYSEWAKADVVFNYRGIKTFFGPQFYFFDSTESNALRASIDDDDCIEVFFVNSFSPPNLWGGGAAFGSGTASAKIISSDANAFGGVDFTHLAHELGHVLGLRHPGASPTASSVAGSSGTLMCPSGFLNDNPTVNSQENENLLSNPLLQFVLKQVTTGPDCLNSADCGACP